MHISKTLFSHSIPILSSKCTMRSGQFSTVRWISTLILLLGSITLMMTICSHQPFFSILVTMILHHSLYRLYFLFLFSEIFSVFLLFSADCSSFLINSSRYLFIFKMIMKGRHEYQIKCHINLWDNNHTIGIATDMK